MKTRSDFVRNSSSSSFIFIDESSVEVKPKIDVENFENDDGEVVLPCISEGQSDFGWQTVRYTDFWSKLNWAALIAMGQRRHEEYEKIHDKKAQYQFSSMENLLKMVCKNELGMNVRLMTEEECDREFVYIDHQSDIVENISNAAMFDSYTAMLNWLFRNSYIQCGNDNV